jgi:hypothetical protein
MKELIKKWRDEAKSESDWEARGSTLRACADELEAALSTEVVVDVTYPQDSIFHETVLHNQKEIKSALDFHKTVLVYFNDSPIPARVINVTNGEKAAVYVQHGKQFFWVRIGKSSVNRIVLHEMRLESV